MSKILIFGHKNPDTDAITSAISLSYLRNQLGEDTEAVALGPVNDETAYALDYFSTEAPRVISSIDDSVEAVYLVDHNEFQQSADNIEEKTILGVVDHHRISNFQTADPLYYRAEPVGCTQTIIYKLYKENDIAIPKDIAGLMLSAIISDSLLFQSPTATPEDEKTAKALAEIAGVNIDEYGLNLLKAGTNVDKFTEEEILEGDAKSFPMGQANVRVGQVNVVDVDDVLKRKEALLEKMADLSQENGYDLYLLIITNILTSDSIGLVYGDHEAELEIAFASSVKDNELDLAGVVSRKKQVVPPLTKAFEG